MSSRTALSDADPASELLAELRGVGVDAEVCQLRNAEVVAYSYPAQRVCLAVRQRPLTVTQALTCLGIRDSRLREVASFALLPPHGDRVTRASRP